MKKSILLLIGYIIIFLMTACSDSADKKEGILGSVSSDNVSETTHPRDENINYRMQLSVCGELPQEFNGEKLSVTTCVKNLSQAFDFSYLVFVNGVKADYSISIDGENDCSDILHVGEEEELYTTLEFYPVNCKKGEDAIVSIEMMFDPGYMLPDTEYVSFTPHHNITGLLPFKIQINSDIPENFGIDISTKAEKTAVTDELREEYTGISADDPSKTVSLLDSSVFFILKQTDKSESYMTCDDLLELDVSAYGLEGKYIVGIYINHELQKAFDGSYYAVCDIQKDFVTDIKAKIDTSKLSGLNHIYLIAVPYDSAQLDMKLISKKTDSKLLLISQGENPTDNPDSDTSTEIITATEEDNSSPNNNPGSQQSESNYEVSSEVSSVISDNNNVSDTFHIDDAQYILTVKQNTLVLLGYTTVMLYDINSKQQFAQFPYSNGDKIQPLDNSIAVYGINGRYIKLYDYDGNLKKEITPPEYDCGVYCISNDEKSIAYSYCDNENGNGYLYVDSINFTDKKLVIQLTADKSGELCGISDILSFDGELICIEGTTLSDDEKYISAFATVRTDGSNLISFDLNEYESLSANYTSQRNMFVITEGYKPDPNEQTGMAVKLCKYGDSKITSFNCEDMHDNHFAYVSENGNLLALINNSGSAGSFVAKIYNLSSGNKLFEKKYNSQSFDIKFSQDETKVYLLCGNQIILIEI